jgi:acetate kinase
MKVFVVNAGSSSLKLRLLDEDDTLLDTHDVSSVDPEARLRALTRFLDAHPEIDVVGHRVVHGGRRFTSAVLLDRETDEELEALADLAPLHNPPSLEAITAISRLRPTMPQVACFDTAFHASLPAKAATYAVPATWRERWGIRRYGFHGLSHAYASRRAAELLGRSPDQLQMISAHLGAGASLAAISQGVSLDTSMGFTPLEGLVMATRSGSIDPGIVFWMQRHGGLSADEVEHALEHDSGLRGLAGGSGDLREVLAGVDQHRSDALLAYEHYVYRLQRGIAALLPALGHLDVLAFTGGAGEAQPRLRADTCAGLGFLGLGELDERRQHEAEDRVVSRSDAVPAVLVIHAREDLEIARQVRALLG